MGYLVFSFALFFIPLNYSNAATECDSLRAQINALDQNDNVNPLPQGSVPEICTVNALSLKVIQIIFYAAGGLAMVFLMIGGVQYIMGMSAGGDEAIGKAKKTITYALVGLVIVLLAGTIVTMVYNLVTGNNGGSSATTTNSGNFIQSGGSSNVNNTNGSTGGTQQNTNNNSNNNSTNTTDPTDPGLWSGDGVNPDENGCYAGEVFNEKTGICEPTQ